MTLISKCQTFLALDIGSYSLKFIEVDISQEKIKLQNFGFGIFSDYENDNSLNKNSVIELIKKISKHYSIKSKKTGVVLPGNKTIIKSIKLSSENISSGDLEPLIYKEAEQIIPFDINEIQLSYDFIKSENQNEIEILIVASKKEIVNTYLDIIKQTNLRPYIADVDYFCLLNIFEKNYSDEYGGKVIAILDIGATSSNIVMLFNKREMFNRDFNVGCSQINKNLERRLKVTFKEAEQIKLNNESNYILREEKEKYFNEIKREISRSFDLFINSSNFDKVDVLFLCGGGSMIKGLKSFLEKNFENLEINYFKSFKSFKIGDNIDENYLEYISPLFTIAAGLALRGEDIG